MKKRAISLSLALLMTFSLLPSALAADQDPPERGTLTFEEIIAPQYEDAQAFSENLAAVKKDGKWGFVNEQNEVVIPFQYAYAWPFSEGRAVVYKEIESLEDAPNMTADAYSDVYSEYSVLELGFIDRENHYTPLLFADDEGTYTVTSTVTYYTMVRTMYVYDYANLKYTDQPRSTETYADENTRPEDLESLFFCNGALKIGDYICGSDGKEILLYVPEGFSHPQIQGPIDNDYVYVIGGLNEGLISIRFQGLNYYLGGYMDATGKLVKLFDYEYFGEPVTRYDENGTPREDRSFHNIYNAYPFNQGLAPATRGTYTVTDTGHDYVDRDYGFIDRDFNWVIPPEFHSPISLLNSQTFQVFSESGIAIVSNADGFRGAIDKKGNTVLPFQYEELWPDYNGRLLFKLDGKYGYLDPETLQVAIPAQYDQATVFNNGIAAVMMGNTFFIIDRQGNQLPDVKSLDTSKYFLQEQGDRTVLRFLGNTIILEEDGKYGIGRLTYVPELPAPDEMDTWAYPEICAAIEKDLVPFHLQCLYRRSITREEFCYLIMNALTEILDMELEELVSEYTNKELYSLVQTYPFTDTSDSVIIAANALGIVGGRGNGIFDPYAPISRQEAAAMLTRAARAVGMDTSSPAPSAFTDRDRMEGWAVESVDYVSLIGVMGGVGENRFDPTGTYTREQAIMTVYRLFQAYQNAQAQ